MGDQGGIAGCLEGLAGAAVRQASSRRSADLAGAARLFGAAEAIRETIGPPLSEPERRDYERDLGILRRALGPLKLASARAEGRALRPEQAVEWARSVLASDSVGPERAGSRPMRTADPADRDE